MTRRVCVFLPAKIALTILELNSICRSLMALVLIIAENPSFKATYSYFKWCFIIILQTRKQIILNPFGIA